MAFDWLEREILGEPVDRLFQSCLKVPDIPVLDDPTCDLRKNSGAADALIAEIDHAELIDLLAPIPVEAQIDRDVARFSPEPKAAPGLAFVKTVLDAQHFMKEVLPTSKVLEEWTPNTQAMVAALIKSAYPSRKKIINDRLDKKLYRPEIMNRWNEMLIAFDNDATVALADDVLVTKAQRFLAKAL
jgi:hypothetical protein